MPSPSTASELSEKNGLIFISMYLSVKDYAIDKVAYITFGECLGIFIICYFIKIKQEYSEIVLNQIEATCPLSIRLGFELGGLEIHSPADWVLLHFVRYSFSLSTLEFRMGFGMLQIITLGFAEGLDPLFIIKTYRIWLLPWSRYTVWWYPKVMVISQHIVSVISPALPVDNSVYWLFHLHG